MLQHPAAVRDAFDEAVATFVKAVRAVPDDRWDTPALGEWTVRELVAHTLRAFTTIEQYLGAEQAVDRPMADAAEYYQVALADPAVHAAVRRRGQEAGAALTDPLGEAEATSQRVLALVASSDDDEPVNTFVGQIGLVEYVATRVVELTVHTMDLQRAVGQPAAIGSAAATVVLPLLTQLGRAEAIVLALTGRAPLPDGFNVLG
jgi:uncharacterized protein (TIGR03083 family)